jgi:rod shape-determining protein MreD
MNPWSMLRASAVFLLLVAAHFSLRPLIGGPAPIDFLSLAVLFAAVRVRPGAAAVIGMLAGFGADSLALSGFGTSALAFTAVAFGASWLKAVFFADNLGLTALFILLGKWAFDVLYVLISGGVPDGQVLVQLLLWSPLSAALTSLVGVMLLVLARPVFGTRRATRRSR